MVQVLYKDAFCTVLNKGEQTESFPIERGCRQGDPLSPTLFVLCIEPLLLAINRDSRIKGLELQDGSTKKISCFADDITALCHSSEDVTRIFDLLGEFEECSGLAVNVDKTEYIKIGSLTPDLDLGEAVKPSKTIKVTGIHLGAGRYRKEAIERNCADTHDKMEAHFKQWHNRSTTVLGRVNLAKWLGLSTLQFLVSCAEVPKEWIGKYNRLVFRFIWKTSDRLKQLVMAKDWSEGGLSMPLIKDIVRAGTCQWFKRCHDFPEAQASRVILHALEKLGGLSVLNGIPDTKKFSNRPDFPSFVTYILNHWGDTTKECGSKIDADSYLWHNKAIFRKVGNKRVPLSPDPLQGLGFNRVGQFYQADGTLIDDEMARKRGLPREQWLRWRAVVAVLKEVIGDQIIIGYHLPGDSTIVEVDQSINQSI